MPSPVKLKHIIVQLSSLAILKITAKQDQFGYPTHWIDFELMSTLGPLYIYGPFY